MNTVAEFSVNYQQILDPRSEPVGTLTAFATDSAELVRMYRMMMLARLMDTKAANLQRTGKLGAYASCLGHEATHVGAGAAMRPDDRARAECVVRSCRQFAHPLQAHGSGCGGGY
jgi:2-oxoisovalerate dehydrogenase E1 component alpha subunit